MNEFGQGVNVKTRYYDRVINEGCKNESIEEQRAKKLKEYFEQPQRGMLHKITEPSGDLGGRAHSLGPPNQLAKKFSNAPVVGVKSGAREVSVNEVSRLFPF